MWRQMPILPQITMKSVCSARKKKYINASWIKNFEFLFVSSLSLPLSFSLGLGCSAWCCWRWYDFLYFVLRSIVSRVAANRKLTIYPSMLTFCVVSNPRPLPSWFIVSGCSIPCSSTGLDTATYKCMHRWQITYVLAKTYEKNDTSQIKKGKNRTQDGINKTKNEFRQWRNYVRHSTYREKKP